nr:ParB/RepB/Spo0J family partition protein [Aureimonas altamirensis]
MAPTNFLPLSSIIEDPDQPRTAFDDEKLEELANSIRERGLIQAITVKPANADGKYMIVSGARRFRASRLAGKDTVLAVIRSEASDSYDQMIENVQREALSHRDTATFIRDQMATGAKKSAIAKSLGKPPAWVTAYADFFDMDPAIQDGMEEYGARAAYELHAAMQIDADKTREFITSGETVTQRSAVAFRQSLKAGQEVPAHLQQAVAPAPAGSALSDVDPNTSNDSPGARSVMPPPVVPDDTAPVSATASIPKPIPSSQEPARSAPDASEVSESGPVSPQEPVSVSATSEPRAALAMRVRDGDRVGRLLLDHEAGQGGSFGVVAFDDGVEEEARLSDLVLLEIVRAAESRSDDA